MRKPLRSTVPAIVAAIALTVLAGCGESPPTRLYLLSAERSQEGSPRYAAANVVIGVETVELSKHLDRPQIVRRSGNHTISPAEFHRWAEPLADHLTRTVADNLSAELGTEAVYVLPRRRTPALSYRVEIEVQRLDADPEGRVTLDARWRLYHGRDDAPQTIRRSQVTLAAAAAESDSGPPEFEPVVAAMSEALATLSREIGQRHCRGRVTAISRRSGVVPAPPCLPRTAAFPGSVADGFKAA